MSRWYTPDGKLMTERVLDLFETEPEACAAASALGGIFRSNRLSGIRYSTPDGRAFRVEFDPLYRRYQLLESVRVP